MSYIPGDIFYKQLVTFNVSGISTNLDSLPTGVLVRNGRDDWSVQTYYTNPELGVYNISGTIPLTYSAHDSLNVRVSGYMAGGFAKAIIDLGVLDSASGIKVDLTQPLSIYNIPETIGEAFLAARTQCFSNWTLIQIGVTGLQLNMYSNNGTLLKTFQMPADFTNIVNPTRRY